MAQGTSIVVESHIPCEACGSSDAKSLYDDGHGYCFSCATYFPPPERELSGTYTYEYVPLRGITKDTLKFYDCKSQIDALGKPIAIGFKYPNGAIQIRSLLKKSFHTEGNISEAPLFGMDKFASGASKTVTITEGAFDALSLHQVLRSPVVSVKSASSAASECASVRDWLNGFDRIYIAFDNDARGRDAVKAVAKLFDYNKVYHVKFTNRKDANEYLDAGESSELKNIWLNAKRYLPDTLISSFDEFEKELSVPPKNGVPYPFPTLTKMTYGIRTGETVLITAREKVGKTSLMRAIEYQLLKETDDDCGVGAIFLEEPKVRHLQSLAGLELRKPAHLPDSGVTVSESLLALKKIVRRDERLHVYSHFGSNDPELLLDTIRFLVTARNCRYILFDHVSIAVSGLFGSEERQALDHLSTRLEMMVKELDFSLLMVSHVNDEGQTRGSRWLTKIADIVINADRDTLAVDPIERNTLRLTVPFNRFCCESGPAGEIIFDPVTYTYSEKSAFGVAANDNFTEWEKVA